MKFRFQDYKSDDDSEIIEIDFNFLKYSELIKSLEPESDSIVEIPEKFKKYEIELFKEILEKLPLETTETGEKIILFEKIQPEESKLLSTKIMKPLLDFFKMSKFFIRNIEKLNHKGIVYVVVCDFGYKLQGHELMINDRLFPGVFLTYEDAMAQIKIYLENNELLEKLNNISNLGIKFEVSHKILDKTLNIYTNNFVKIEKMDDGYIYSLYRNDELKYVIEIYIVQKSISMFEEESLLDAEYVRNEIKFIES